ncbi:hypothetical protein ARTHRO9AX_220106 [Arthrobacter sp. 9AX]|nr:hypothetical protein ARTHRO9AX_220106 [Arthrobacter sp. 9AX]
MKLQRMFPGWSTSCLPGRAGAAGSLQNGQRSAQQLRFYTGQMSVLAVELGDGTGKAALRPDRAHPNLTPRPPDQGGFAVVGVGVLFSDTSRAA